MPTLSFFAYLLLLGASYLLRVSYRGWFGLYLFLAMVTVPLLLVVLSLPSVFTMGLSLNAPSSLSKTSEESLQLRFHSRSPCRLGG